MCALDRSEERFAPAVLVDLDDNISTTVEAYPKHTSGGGSVEEAAHLRSPEPLSTELFENLRNLAWFVRPKHVTINRTAAHGCPPRELGLHDIKYRLHDNMMAAEVDGTPVARHGPNGDDSLVSGLPHGYTNRTRPIQSGVEKRYEGMDAFARAEREYACLKHLHGKYPVPEVVKFNASSPGIVLNTVAGRHGQELIDEGHANSVLRLIGEQLAKLQAIASATVRVSRDQ